MGDDILPQIKRVAGVDAPAFVERQRCNSSTGDAYGGGVCSRG